MVEEKPKFSTPEEFEYYEEAGYKKVYDIYTTRIYQINSRTRVMVSTFEPHQIELYKVECPRCQRKVWEQFIDKIDEFEIVCPYCLYVFRKGTIPILGGRTRTR